MNAAFLTVATLWQREMVRFYRQPSRVVGALGSPLVFWLLIGSGLGKSFQAGGMGYLEYFFPGTLLLILLFTSIFSTISLIEDRHEGFLQSVLIAPVPRASLVLGKILGGATLSFVQGFLFLLLAPFVGIHLTAGSWFLTMGIIFLNGFALTGLGFLIAWQLDSLQGFHAIMNLFLIPLWLLSGALFPGEGAPVWMTVLMRINPLTYGVLSLRSALFGITSGPSLGFCLVIVFVFALTMLALATMSAERKMTSS